MMKKQSLDRKDFLRIVAAAGAAGLTAKWGWGALRSPRAVQETRLLMGTVVNLTVVGEDRQASQDALTSCFNRMEELETVLSRHRPDSQLSRLNEEGRLIRPSSALVEVIGAAQTISRETGGKFDITVKPLLDLYQRHQQVSSALPPRAALEAALGLVDYRKVFLDEHEIQLGREGMALTLDGIAKGYIVDAGVDSLDEHGFANVLVEAGGDLGAFGQKSPDHPWTIGVRSPRDENQALLTKLTVRSRSLATSGDYLQSFSPDFRHHHILDPQRGISSPELASASVIAPSALAADAYATALMVMGAEEGRSLVERLPDVEALMVTKDLAVRETSGFGAFRSSAA